MGLKQDLLEAKIEALKLDGATEESIERASADDSALSIQCEMEKEAIIKYLTNSNFTITQLKAPIILEDIKTSDQAVNVELQTLLGDKGPILDTLKQIGSLIPGAGPAVTELIDALEEQIEKAVKPLLEGGSTLPGLDLSKGDGLDSTGYVVIGEDPESQGSFDVSDEDGQREFTTVILNEDDARKNE